MSICGRYDLYSQRHKPHVTSVFSLWELAVITTPQRQQQDVGLIRYHFFGEIIKSPHSKICGLRWVDTEPDILQKITPGGPQGHVKRNRTMIKVEKYQFKMGSFLYNSNIASSSIYKYIGECDDLFSKTQYAPNQKSKLQITILR